MNTVAHFPNCPLVGGNDPSCYCAPATAPREPQGTAPEFRLRDWISDRIQGTCKMLSLGEDCPCALCALDEIMAEISRLTESLERATEERDDAIAGQKIIGEQLAKVCDYSDAQDAELSRVSSELDEARRKNRGLEDVIQIAKNAHRMVTDENASLRDQINTAKSLAFFADLADDGSKGPK